MPSSLNVARVVRVCCPWEKQMACVESAAPCSVWCRLRFARRAVCLTSTNGRNTIFAVSVLSAHRPTSGHEVGPGIRGIPTLRTRCATRSISSNTVVKLPMERYLAALWRTGANHGLGRSISLFPFLSTRNVSDGAASTRRSSSAGK